MNTSKYNNKTIWITCNMATIYLVNILHKTLIYSKYTHIVSIIERPFNANNNP